jgi:hypothetical protein
MQRGEFRFPCTGAQGASDMPSDPKDYRERARQCAALAHETDDPKLKATFLELARAWTEVVAEIERRSGAQADRLGEDKRFRIEQFLVNAAEAEENFRQAANDDVRELYYQAAVSWAELAKDVAELERSPRGCV